MLLAEALAQRADLQSRLDALRNRLRQNARVQEGDAPDEDPAALLAEYDAACDALEALIRQINHTNAVTPVEGYGTLTDALAARDVLRLRRSGYDALLQGATDRFDRFSRTEIKVETTVDVRALQQRVDALAKAHRDLDLRIQQLNWTAELRE